jgi:hypothetical protein
MAGSKKEQTQIIVISLPVFLWVVLMFNKSRTTGNGEQNIEAFKKKLGLVSDKGKSLLKEYNREIEEVIGKRDPLQKPKVVVEKEIEEAEKKVVKSPKYTEAPKEKKEKEVVVDKAKYELQGIVWGNTNPVAIISGEVVATGDVVSGAKVLKIQKDNVVLSLGTQKFTIEMER